MGRYVTPAGVVIETSEKAAQAIGYKPAEEKSDKAPAKKAASSKSEK